MATKVFHKGCVSAEVVQKIIAPAMAEASSLGVPQVVAILDEGGLPKGFCRMDAAPLISIEVAQNKAYTALLDAPSQDLFNRVKDDPALAAAVPHIPRSVTFGGGLPIRIDGAVVGAGVSGGSVERDVACAQAGLDVIGNS
jgi:uncharacterized protein GlcG (DUF336 family)